MYAWIYAAQAGFSPRAVLMAGLITAWAVRLTFNFWRKGGFRRGGEDYRWAVLRERLPGWAWPPFNVLFVAGYQNLLVWLITLPAWRAAGAGGSVGALDGVVAALFLGALLGEFVADQQQWDFHQAKAERVARGAAGPRFLSEGMWRWSRHPNFFFEQAQWWLLTWFPVAAGLPWLDATLLGPLLLTLLFDGSTRFTESITRSKYAEYEEYQRTTSRWLPWPPRG